MSGIVGVIANDSARFSLFPACLSSLEMPEDARPEWLIGGDWCSARNTLVRLVLEEELEWLWFMDDDHTFPPGILKKLLSWDEPLVTPVCLTRAAPFLPVQFTERIPEADRQYLQLPLGTMTQSRGLVELEAGGCAGMLIRREVLAAVEQPWFEYGDRSEDIIFCEKAKAAGFQIYCDLSQRLGHITTAVVEPAVINNEWVVGLTVGRSLKVPIRFQDQGGTT